MGKRISKVYTRTGDDGTTGMADGSRLRKNAPVMVAIGDVDELNAAIGMLRAEESTSSLDDGLEKVQNVLFELGGELSMPEYQTIGETHVLWLETEIDRMNGVLPTLEEFILPAGSRTVALCHQARTVARRAERSIVSVEPPLRADVLRYINRLSDYLFVLARYIAHIQGIDEVYWQQ